MLSMIKKREIVKNVLWPFKLITRYIMRFALGQFEPFSSLLLHVRWCYLENPVKTRKI